MPKDRSERFVGEDFDINFDVDEAPLPEPEEPGDPPQLDEDQKQDAFNPDEPRDESGKWSGGGGSGSSKEEKRAAMKAHLAAKKEKEAQARAAFAHKAEKLPEVKPQPKASQAEQNQQDPQQHKQDDVDARKAEVRKELQDTHITTTKHVLSVAAKVHLPTDPSRSFISDVYEAMPNSKWKSLDDFKAYLSEESRAGRIHLTRLDLKAAHPMAAQSKSVLRRGEAEFHLIDNSWHG